MTFRHHHTTGSKHRKSPLHYNNNGNFNIQFRYVIQIFHYTMLSQYVTKIKIGHHNMITEKIDALLVTETWLSERDTEKFGSRPLILIRKILTYSLLTEKKEEGVDLD